MRADTKKELLKLALGIAVVASMVGAPQILSATKSLFVEPKPTWQEQLSELTLEQDEADGWPTRLKQLTGIELKPELSAERTCLELAMKKGEWVAERRGSLNRTRLDNFERRMRAVAPSQGIDTFDYVYNVAKLADGDRSVESIQVEAVNECKAAQLNRG